MTVRIDASDPDHLRALLTERGWLPSDAALTGVERAGEGNMNRVLRVHWRGADGVERSGIAKQSSPFVEKFPDIPAPEERILVEADFYALTARTPGVADAMPHLFGTDEAHHLAWLEDLGAAADFSDRYGARPLEQEALDALLRWLSALHAVDVDAASWPRLRNCAMRDLNHAHLFEVPLDPAIDVDAHCPGLQAAAAPLRADTDLTEALRRLGEHYLADGPTLLHGDFYPGSWLATADGPRVIDPEFAFLGCAEYDVGVLRAHLDFTDAASLHLDAYDGPPGFDAGLADAFAGMERIRRLLGVAQLPLTADLDERIAWLDVGRRALLAWNG